MSFRNPLPPDNQNGAEGSAVPQRPESNGGKPMDSLLTLSEQDRLLLAEMEEDGRFVDAAMYRAMVGAAFNADVEAPVELEPEAAKGVASELRDASAAVIGAGTWLSLHDPLQKRLNWLVNEINSIGVVLAERTRS